MDADEKVSTKKKTVTSRYAMTSKSSGRVEVAKRWFKEEEYRRRRLAAFKEEVTYTDIYISNCMCVCACREGFFHLFRVVVLCSFKYQ